MSLKGNPDRGRAFNGLVEAQLRRDKLKASRIEYKNIRDQLWRVRAEILTADYHLVKARADMARRILADAVKRVQTKGRRRGADDTYLNIAIRQANMRDFSAALATAGRLSIPLERLDAYLSIADKAVASSNEKVRSSSRKMFLDAFTIAKTLKHNDPVTMDILLRIALAQIKSKRKRDALSTLRYLRPILLKSSFNGWQDRVAILAGRFILAGDNKSAMSIVRGLENIGYRAQSMSEVAHAIAYLGDLDSAVPLFSLAFQDTQRLDSENQKFEVIRHLVNRQSKVGRLADAFKMAGYVRDRRMQALTILSMGKALLEINDYKNAELVTEYIPFIGMRSQIFTTLANVKGTNGEPNKASSLLTKGLTDTPLKKISPESLEKALISTIEIQSRVGSPEAAETLFQRVRTLAKLFPTIKPRVKVMSNLAVALAKIGKKKIAQEDLDVAWRLAWRDTKHKYFAEMLSYITDAQLAAGFILQAFDTAARIPDEKAPSSRQGNENIDASMPFESPRNRALRSVAMAAGQLGQPKLAIRAVRAIADETARALAIANIVVTVAEAESRKSK
ncbi:MAG: hypothetical protein VX430_04385 [Pseudomonadota bacterium]|nr:hypothetical protein [Pseudomonadota bacterium]